MSVTETKTKKGSCDIVENVSKNTMSLPLQEHNLKNTLPLSNMPEHNFNLRSKELNIALKKNIIAMNKLENCTLIDNNIDKLSGTSHSIGNAVGHSNDYIFKLCNQNTDHNTNHKFYGCKKREFTTQLCESFGLPDSSIFSKTSLLLDRFPRSPLDVDIANPWDICVVNLDYIDQPWLIETQEVITPYWDVESLFPFEIDDIRHKVEPEEIDFSEEKNTSHELVEGPVNNSIENDNIFTSTPLKSQDNSSGNVSVVSRINIESESSNVDLSLLKDHIIKALEVAVKQKSVLTNIDMKIEIIDDINGNSQNSPQTSSMKLKIDNNSKNGSLGLVDKHQNSKESKCSTLSDLSKDWQDTQESNLAIPESITEREKNYSIDNSDIIKKRPRGRPRKKRGKPRKFESETLRYINPVSISNIAYTNGSQSSIENGDNLNNKYKGKMCQLKQEASVRRNSLRSTSIPNDSIKVKSLNNKHHLKNQYIPLGETLLSTEFEPRFEAKKHTSSSTSSEFSFKNRSVTTENSSNFKFHYNNGENLADNKKISTNNSSYIQQDKYINKELNNIDLISRDDLNPKKINTDSVSSITRRSLKNKLTESEQIQSDKVVNYKFFTDTVYKDNTLTNNVSVAKKHFDIQKTCKDPLKKGNFDLSKHISLKSVGKRVTRNGIQIEYNNDEIFKKGENDTFEILKESAVDRQNKKDKQRVGITHARIPNNDSPKLPGASNSLTEQREVDVSSKRILRSSNQDFAVTSDESERGRRRTFSGSVTEPKCEDSQTDLPRRNRSVSVSSGTKSKLKELSPPLSRRLRSKAPEINVSSKLRTLEYEPNGNSGIPQKHSKSPKITFNLNSSMTDSPENMRAKAQLKSILKNPYSEYVATLNKKIQQDREMEDNSSLVGFYDLPKLLRQDNLEADLDDGVLKSKCLRDNGITSRIKVVISPMEVKEETDESVDKECPVLPLEVSVGDETPLKKHTPEQMINKQAPRIKLACSPIHSDIKPSTDNVDFKDIKTEPNVYEVGHLVWAQVGKFPYWPAIICNDPNTETYYYEVKMKNKPNQMYHIRFFGDSGRRSWVNKTHLMSYCSKQDLEMIATKLKSESKHHNIIKPYLITGAQRLIDKWHKGVEEIESHRDKTPEETIRYLIQSYEAYVRRRREKRKLNCLDASSESESEEPETNEKPRRKRFKSSHYAHPITAEDSGYSLDLGEINISLGDKNKTVEVTNTTIEYSAKQAERKRRKSERISDKLEAIPIDNIEIDLTVKNEEDFAPRRSRRSMKPVDKADVSDLQPNNLSSSLDTERGLLKVTRNSVGPTSLSSKENELMESDSNASKKQPDEVSEIESKASSDGSSSSANMYSFEYQVELHKKNNLFNGLTRAKVCDYCFKQGDLYKCKGKCGGSFHLECASKVTQPRGKKYTRREKSPTKARLLENSVGSTPKSKRSEDCCKTRSQSQCQIITIKSSRAIATPKRDNLPKDFHMMSIAEQIDYGMKELMGKFETRTMYDSTDTSSEEGSIDRRTGRAGVVDSPTSTSTVGSANLGKTGDVEETVEDEKSSDDLEVSLISENASNNSIKHVTADSVILTEVETPMDITNLKCTYCRMERDPPCFACGLEVSSKGDRARQKCSNVRCGRYYHTPCLKMWPQTQWSIGKWSKYQQPEDSFTCPAHKCHTCFSEELGSNAACRLPGDKLARCLLCPAAFHISTFCIPAGSEVLGGSQIVCPRHRQKSIQPINTVWCFICSEGGNLVCCDTCPTSVHPECQPVNFTDDDKYICEDCESGRFPLYDEIVWVKLGQYRWWPAIILFPNEVPENVRAIKHQRGDFAVRFFGTNDHYWVNKARSFLFQEGDRGGSPGEMSRSKNKVYETFGKAIEDAALAYKLKKEFKLRREAECINSLKPPPYVRINKNKPVGNVKCIELDLSNATACECDPDKPHPCGPDSNCINRLLMTECDPDVCPAGNRCRNQSFQKREYPPMIPYKTQGRGWGLKSLAPIKTGQFVIEYVGELIDSEEYQRRIKKMHEKKEENYYFMTVDSDRMIDAGPKGNLSRFMNHSCNPNCVTQKWTVKGDTRVGLFAKRDVESGSELTFNYNLEVVGQEKKVCKCGAPNCSGYIGVKAKLDKPEKSQTDSVSTPPDQRRARKPAKKRTATPPFIPPCFMCGRKKSDITCNNKFCNKGYHLRCLKLDEMPDTSKYACPRHNCNVCSNRTIRCCVKCTNSFCPSHSEGNVRHDKFLGFVCRLHDPGISSAEGSTESVKDTKQKSKNRGRLSLCDSQRKKTEIAKVESFGSVWRNQVQHSAGHTPRYNGMIDSCYKIDRPRGRPRKNNVNTTHPNLKTIVKRVNGCKISSNRRPSLPVDEGGSLRSRWRSSSKSCGSRNRTGLKKLNMCKTYNEDAIDLATSIPENNVTSLADVLLKPETAETQIATSQNIDDPHEIAPSTAAERSEFDSCKSGKRRRSKIEPTDESAVSSTTSDEGSSTKPSSSKRISQRERDRGADKDDQVSSSPRKDENESWSGCSEDELSRSMRRKSVSKGHKLRKKIQFNVNRLASTAK